ncbi:MAG: hypothetical protein M1812_005367 [Candelaria pacifica]|nr:MAG: hypothetical protein M1812_005367 [Candelaria pacifica]
MRLLALLSLFIAPYIIIAFPLTQDDELDTFLRQRPLHTTVLLAAKSTPTTCSTKRPKAAWWRYGDNDEAAEKSLSGIELRRKSERWIRDIDDEDEE